MPERAPGSEPNPYFPPWNPNGESFTAEEEDVLESSPDWYTKLVYKWLTEVLKIMPPFLMESLRKIKSLDDLQKVKEERPYAYSSHYKGFAEQHASKEEVVGSIKRKFTEIGYSSERSEKIAEDYIIALKQNEKEISDDATRTSNEKYRQEQILESFDDLIDPENPGPANNERP